MDCLIFSVSIIFKHLVRLLFLEYTEKEIYLHVFLLLDSYDLLDSAPLDFVSFESSSKSISNDSLSYLENEKFFLIP